MNVTIPVRPRRQQPDSVLFIFLYCRYLTNGIDCNEWHPPFAKENNVAIITTKGFLTCVFLFFADEDDDSQDEDFEDEDDWSD